MSTKGKKDMNEVVATTSFAKKESEQFDLGSLPEGAIGLKPKGIAAKKTAAKRKSKDTEKVALFAERNIAWTEVGTLKKGYNIVNKDVSEKWLTRKNVRLATPEEIAREYNV